MGIDIVRLLSVGSVNQNYSINPNRSHRVSFGETLSGDTFQSTTINRYTSEAAIIDMIKKNPEISKILKKESVPLELNIKGLKELLNTHGTDARDIASGIIENLPFGLRDRVNPQSVKDAAYLHDLGKVLIPKEILYKEGKLSPKETNIMHLHSELGYQLLKTTDIDTTTLNLIRYHHQNQLKSGYPFVDNTFFADINQQIVSLADKYSALTEKRSYKKPMTSKEALTVILKDVNEGKYNPLIFNSLVKYSQQTENISYIKA